MEEIRYDQQGLGVLQMRIRRLHHAVELEERIELQKLNAGLVEDLFFGGSAEGKIEDAVGPGVAIVVGVAEQTSG